MGAPRHRLCVASDDKIAFAKQHGAAEGVNYATADLREAASARSAASMASTWSTTRSAIATPSRRLRSLAWLGRYLVVGFAAGEIPRLPLNLLLLKGCDVRGVFWGSWTERDPRATAPTRPSC